MKLNKIHVLFILIIILITISLICIKLKNQSNILREDIKEMLASEEIKEETLEEDEENLDIKGIIQVKNDNDYEVKIDVVSDKCIKSILEIQDDNTTKALIDENEEIYKPELTAKMNMQKNKLYRFKIQLANGEEIEKEFSLKSAKLLLNEPVKNENGSWTFPNFTIENPCEDKIKNLIIQFASEIKSGDKLSIEAIPNAIITQSDTMITINTENLTTDELQQAIRENLKINLVSRAVEEEVDIKVSIADTFIEKTLNYCTATNHYYEYVETSYGISWIDAKNEAEQRYYLGQQGYLATITSEEEQNFMSSLVKGYGWIGGTDDYNYIFDSNGNRIYNSINESKFNFHWVTGPETGEKFEYTNWQNGQPDCSRGRRILCTFVGWI